MPQQTPHTSRTVHFFLFVIGLLWLYVSHTASGFFAPLLSNITNLVTFEPLLEQALFLGLLLVGFTALARISLRTGTLRTVNALPHHDTATQEFGRGAALGWAMLLAVLLPAILVGDLHPTLWLAPRAWLLTFVSLAALALYTLALEVAFRGYLYTRLISAINPVAATTLLSLVYATLSISRPNASPLSAIITFLLALLLSLAYLRTHALYLGWGIHFGWNAAMAILFGLPIAGDSTFSGIVSSDVSGHTWLTGGAYGPEAAFLAIVVALAAIPVLYRITRDYAWLYTAPEIVPAGVPVIIAPPKAHTDMEEAAAAKPASLVQILSTTPTAPSTMKAIEEHLRTTSSTDPAD